jgi:periplasmic protein TonB
MDLSFSPSLSGGDITQLHAQGKGDKVGADWFNEVSAWWIRHRFYPEEAARLAQQGDVVLQLVVAPSGHVESLVLEQGSGSPWLDMGAEAVFRSANLPPLPGNIQDPNITVDFTIHYQVVR